MPRKKKEDGTEIAADPIIKPVGDPFFDDPPEVYWSGEKAIKEVLNDATLEGGLYVVPDDILVKDIASKQTAELNTLLIPLTNIRLRIAELQLSGVTHMPLGDFIKELHKVYHESIASDE